MKSLKWRSKRSNEDLGKSTQIGHFCILNAESSVKGQLTDVGLVLEIECEENIEN